MASSIEWTQEVWNPTRGCSLVSPGCTNCYAMRQAHRFSGKGQPYEGLTQLREKNGPVWTGAVRFVPEMLSVPLRWKRPRRVFVNSMSDLFHSEVTNEEIAAVFGVMAACPQHTFQILTKRAKRMHSWFQWVAAHPSAVEPSRMLSPYILCAEHAAHRLAVSVYELLVGEWPLPNVHLLVSVEDQERADERIPLLLQTPAAVRGVSYEPALGPVDLRKYIGGLDEDASCVRCGVSADLHSGYPCPPGFWPSLDWIIVGGESGPGARPFNPSWAKDVIAQCKAAGVACFMKQLGSNVLDFSGTRRTYKGGDPTEWPEDLRVREYPRSQHAEDAQ